MREQMEIPNLSAICEQGYKRYQAVYDEIPDDAEWKQHRQGAIAANRALDTHCRKQLESLFEKLPNQGRYLAYRLIGTDHIFLIRRTRGRKDIRYGFLASDATLGEHWMQWDDLGDMSGIGGLFLWGLAKLYDIEV